MILVYSPKITSRIQYAMGLLLRTHLGYEWELTNKKDRYMAWEGPRLNYGGKPAGGPEVLVDAAGLLSERGVRDCEPEVAHHHQMPLLFPSSRKDARLPLDPFSASFYLVSRYEEYLPHQKDPLGRFEARESFAFRHGFIQIPVVDHYALMLNEALKDQYPALSGRARQYTFIPTYDVDVAYAYRGRGVLRSLLGALRSLSARDGHALKERVRVLMGRQADPFDTYDAQLALHARFGLQAHYFFLCGDHGLLDRNIAFFSAAFQHLVKKTGDYATIGIHPSVASFTEPRLLETEIRRLECILNREVRHSRQHYLMLSFPASYQALLRQEVTADFSMGFASQPGFRAGTCTPFPFYDLEREAVTGLKVFPFAVMDGTLNQYLGLKPQEALARIRSLIASVRQVKGTFISLWHNDALSERGIWKDWRHVYEELLAMAAGQAGQETSDDPLPGT